MYGYIYIYYIYVLTYFDACKSMQRYVSLVTARTPLISPGVICICCRSEDLSTMNGVYINNYQDYMPGGRHYM
jgi:hypothetical protein